MLEDRKTPFRGSLFSEVVVFYGRAGILHEPGVLADVAFVGAGERVARENLVLRLRGVAGGDCRGAIADVGEGDVAFDAGLDFEFVELSADGLDVERLLLDRHKDRLGRGTA